MAQEELWSAVQGILGQSSVESFLKSGSFVDLGSGEGELVLTALRLFPDLTRGVGVELSQERQDEAMKNAQAQPEVGLRAEFLQGDMCDENNVQIMEAIATARLLFVSNVMFEEKLMACVSRVIRKFIATQGQAAVVIAVGKQLDLEDRVTSRQSGLMTGSWGLAPAYVYGILG
eukprot:Skav231364  [mRNA]  locus=scaffold1586:396836:397357:+ [translate_table: standard]